MCAPGGLLGPGEDVAGRRRRGKRVEGGCGRSPIEDLGPGALLRPAHRHRLTAHDLVGRCVLVVALGDQDRLGGADADAGRLQPDVQPVRAEVALLRAVVDRVDEDRVVRAGRHARLAADAGVLGEVHDPVRPGEHRPGRAGRHARGVLALVAPGDLEGAAGLREGADVDALHEGAGHRQRHVVLRLARCGAGVAADALGLVQHLEQATARRRRCGSVGRGVEGGHAPLLRGGPTTDRAGPVSRRGCWSTGPAW